jgi:HPt (histidine-containing phosphotransfer) domain-containing protein
VSDEQPGDRPKSRMERVRAQLRGTYLAGLPTWIQKIEDARAACSGDAPEGEAALRGLGHQLKGSGAAYGFPEISTLGDQLEAAPSEALDDAAVALIAWLRQTHDKG